MEPTSLPELRAQLTRLADERLEIGQLLAKVPEGPGYYDALQPLLARKVQVNADYNATQKEIKARLQGVQPTLF